jgi:hypothetical protein
VSHKSEVGVPEVTLLDAVTKQRLVNSQKGLCVL